MDTISKGELGLQSRGDRVPLSSKEVLGITMGSDPMYSLCNEMNSIFDDHWDRLISTDQNAEYVSSLSGAYDQIDCSSYTDLVESQRNGHSLEELVRTNIPSFVDDGSFSMTDSFFGLHNCHQNSSSSRILDYPLGRTAKEKELTSQITAKNLEKKKEKLDPSLDGKKRQRVSDDRSQFAELKLEKDGSIEGEAQKEDYVHVRAKKGRSTNSHNLAERARRERIRERMKVLQDLVPGCSKITGKAVMLDEIINYVLSLQRQVNLLSMKMARVYPEMNAEQIVSGKIHHSQGHNAAILGDPVKAFSYPVSKENL